MVQTQDVIRDSKCKFYGYLVSQKQHFGIDKKSANKKIKSSRCNQCQYASSRKMQPSLHGKKSHGTIGSHKCKQCDYSSGENGSWMHTWKVSMRKAEITSVTNVNS